MESHSTQSSDPSHDDDTADEITIKAEAQFKRIKEDSINAEGQFKQLKEDYIKAGRSTSLIRNICSELGDQREIEQLNRIITNQD